MNSNGTLANSHNGSRVHTASPRSSSAWHRPALADFAGTALIMYYVLVFAYRYSIRGWAGASDMLWACNVSLLLAAFGMLTHNANIIAGAVGMIAMAHFLWLLDVAAYLALGLWPVGLAKYITWPSTTHFEILTTLHHVWFIPLCFTVLYKNGRLNVTGWRYSIYAALILSVISRYTTPLTMDGIYLNINLAHEFWKDVEVPFFHCLNPPTTPWPLYLSFMLTIVSAVNSILYVFWRYVHFIVWPDILEAAKQA